MAPAGEALAPAEADGSGSRLSSSGGGGATLLSGDWDWGCGCFSRERGRWCSRGLCSMLGDRDLCFLDSWEPRRSRGRSGLLPLGCQCLRARSRLLGGEHSRSQGLDPDHLCFRLLLPRVSWEELPELHERDRDPRQPRPREPLSLLLSPSLAFFRLARSWPLEWSLEDLRLLALSRCLLEWSSPAGGDMDCEVLSPERELERVLLCSLAAARFLLSVFPPRELDVECKQGEDCSSTMRWVAGGGVPGSAMVTQVTVRSSEPKKVL